jgi:NhaP-type Na+/H+ or K+/H+ antiporter
MIGKRAILVLAILALVVAILQKTPLAFLPEDAADFAWGCAIGLTIGAVISWLAERSSE